MFYMVGEEQLHNITDLKFVVILYYECIVLQLVKKGLDNFRTN